MKVILAHSKEEWNNWLLQESNEPSFLQSWEWGDVIVADGRSVERVMVESEGEVHAVAQLLYKTLPFGLQYAFCPKGPIFSKKNGSQAEKEACFDALVRYVRQKKCLFLRVEPAGDSDVDWLRFPGLKKVLDIETPTTLIKDVGPTLDELLASFHAKTRYNIRLALRKADLVVSDEKNFKAFWQLMKETAVRDGFSIHSAHTYEAVLASPAVFQKTVLCGDVPIAVGIFFKFGTILTYIYGASNHAYRAYMAPPLIQWEGIQLAKKLECEGYDFFGIAPPEKEIKENQEVVMLASGEFRYAAHHRYARITQFKVKFGGRVVHDPGTFDVVCNSAVYNWYTGVRMIMRLVWRLVRGRGKENPPEA